MLKIISASDFYVDFNENNTAEENELVQLFYIDKDSDILTPVQNAQLSYLSKSYANSVLLNNRVKLFKKPDSKLRVFLPDGSDYVDGLFKKGLVLSENNKDKVFHNLEYAKTLNLVSLNVHSKKYHKLGCKYAFESPNVRILTLKELPVSAKPCKFCHLTKKLHKSSSSSSKKEYPKDVYEKYSPVYKDSFVELYITDFTKYYYPSQKCLTTVCKSLLKEINNAQSTIDFAIYGIDKQPYIANALIDAQKRGVKVRWVYDTDRKGKTIYSETFKLKKTLTNARADYETADKVLSNGKTIRDSIMHNKFFIFDSKKVWTGSANITYTDLSGFNANSAILINSQSIAQLYKNEFEQMYKGSFHQLKLPTPANFNRVGNSLIIVNFSPQDKIIVKNIIPLINNAKKYVYIPVFVITHKEFNQALLNAKNRGVDVRIIVDATSAGSKFSSVRFLRQNNIKVKTENRAGKMHMKSIIIDDEYVVIGSMNFTRSGENYNDENVLIIKNPSMAQAFKNKFLYLYSQIPDKWLYKNPAAESFNSINSCYDGIDNDFDGKVDMLDDSCNYKLRKEKQKI